MKTLSSILKVFSASALLLASCVNEDPQYKQGNGSENPDSGLVGYLAPGAFDMRVLFDTQTEVNPDDTGDSKPSLATRANPDIDTFTLEILDAEQNTFRKMTYAEWKTQTLPIALPVGSYTLKAYSEATIPDAAWEHPVYHASSEFAVQKADTMSLPAIVCTLANIKVSLIYSADLNDWLSSDTKAEFTLGSQKALFVKGETRSVYFRPETNTNTIDFQLTGTFSDTNRPVSLTKHLTDVKAGQWRKVSLVIQNADKGNASIGIKIDTFVQDEEITVNGTEGLWEETITEEDPSLPTILWPGHNLSKQFQLLATMFDEQNHCTEPFAFNITSPNGIQALTVEIGSNNSAFLEALAAQQIPTSFDLCTVPESGALYSALKALGLPVGNEVAGQKKLSIDIAAQMPQLYTYDGTFTFAFAVTDTNNSTTKATLSLLVDKESEKSVPEIVWRGYDIETSHKLTQDMAIAVDVTSKEGIKSFVVTIDSEILAPFLQIIGLPREFDLCTVTGTQAETLKELGFPTGKEVVAPLSFDITQFVPVLIGMDAGEHKFILTVTDNKNNTTIKTIHVINEK